MNEVMNKIEELKHDPVFAEKIQKAESLSEVAKLFSDEGVKVTEAELQAEAEKDNDELNEDALDSVTGGVGVVAVVKVVAGAYVAYKLLRGYIDGIKC